MAKRKRQEPPQDARDNDSSSQMPKRVKATTTATAAVPRPRKEADKRPPAIHIITGSYDRILHGVVATIDAERGAASFADTFLFSAHTGAIRCLALSPASRPAAPGTAQKVLLASGGADERINVYSLSAHPPSAMMKKRQPSSSAFPRPVAESSRNREVGTLLHHSSAITALAFPTRDKLLSASEDSTVGVTRTRDWQILSTIRAPVPKAQGRPSGDTAPTGGTPSGFNDFAVHPSKTLMVSVGRGERCMRLWNLVTGRKGGVLDFDRDMLREVGEGKRHSAGEGRRVVWGRAQVGAEAGRGGEGEFAVAFDKDVVVFGMDSVPRCRVMGGVGGHASGGGTKVHRIRYLSEGKLSLLAVSTEDGRILFFSTATGHLYMPSSASGGGKLPVARLVAQVGGKDGGVTGRIKDFVMMPHSGGGADTGPTALYIAGGSSDGTITLWKVGWKELQVAAEVEAGTEEGAEEGAGAGTGAYVGKVLGRYDTQNRITCLEAFMMIPRPEGVDDSSEDEDSSEDDEGVDESDGSDGSSGGSEASESNKSEEE